jgi:hypothetical protein
VKEESLLMEHINLKHMMSNWNQTMFHECMLSQARWALESSKQATAGALTSTSNFPNRDMESSMRMLVWHGWKPSQRLHMESTPLRYMSKPILLDPPGTNYWPDISPHCVPSAFSP